MPLEKVLDRLNAAFDRQLDRINSKERVNIPTLPQPKTEKEMLSLLEDEDRMGYIRARLSGGDSQVIKAQALLGALRARRRK